MKILNEEVAYNGLIIQVIKKDVEINGKVKKFETARRSPGTRMIIFDEKNKKYLITKEYRFELKADDYRLPGGKVFDTLEEYSNFLKSGENILKAAEQGSIKEASQETGLNISNPQHIYTSKCGTTVEWDLYYFLVTDFAEIKSGQDLELGENIEVKWMSKDEVLDLCISGKFSEDRSAAVIMRHLLKKG